MQNRIRIGSLWTGKTKSGEEFLSGSFGPNARLLVFKNNFKQGDKDPDFAVYVVPREREAGPAGEPAQEGPDASPPQPPRRTPLRPNSSAVDW